MLAYEAALSIYFSGKGGASRNVETAACILRLMASRLSRQTGKLPAPMRTRVKLGEKL
jgi:hypothetical protein